MKKITKKGQIDALQPLILTLIVVGVILVVGFLIFSQLRTQATAMETLGLVSYSVNASNAATNAMQDIPGWLPIIVVVVIGALLISLVSFLRGQAR